MIFPAASSPLIIPRNSLCGGRNFKLRLINDKRFVQSHVLISYCKCPSISGDGSIHPFADKASVGMRENVIHSRSLPRCTVEVPFGGFTKWDSDVSPFMLWQQSAAAQVD